MSADGQDQRKYAHSSDLPYLAQSSPKGCSNDSTMQFIAAVHYIVQVGFYKHQHKAREQTVTNRSLIQGDEGRGG